MTGTVISGLNLPTDITALRHFGSCIRDWIVKPLTDGVMIQMMARENGESYKTNAAVLRETISSAVEALGAGKILPEEIPFKKGEAQRTDAFRYAPSFSCPPAGQLLQLDENKRYVEKYPLLGAKVDELCESIEATDFWENIVVRVNDAGRPELAYGHHRLAALRKLYPSTKEFDWIVKPLTDGVMIQMMALENGESYKTNTEVTRETISAAVEALGAGRILAEEIALPKDVNDRYMRYAPSFSAPVQPGCTGQQVDENKRKYPYTIEALAKFLGMVRVNGAATENFTASFGALELINEGYLTEARIKGLGPSKLAEVVSAVKSQREAAIAESQRLAREAEARRQEAIRKAEELKRQQEAAEARRKAAAEAERLAAIKRAEEKAKRDAEDKVRREEEEKQRKIAAEKRAKEEAARKEEEERLRKIREAQKAEADRQRAEAEKLSSTQTRSLGLQSLTALHDWRNDVRPANEFCSHCAIGSGIPPRSSFFCSSVISRSTAK